jgi:hypothetical protein
LSFDLIMKMVINNILGYYWFFYDQLNW